MTEPLSSSESLPRGESGFQPFVLTLFAACLGIVADRFVPLATWHWLALASAAVLFWFVAFAWRQTGMAAVLLLLGISAAAGAWRHTCWHEFAADEIGLRLASEPQPTCIEVVALSPPRWTPAPAASPLRTIPKGDDSRLLVRVLAVRDGVAWRPASGQARLYVEGHLLDLQAGDRLRVFGSLAAPLPPQNPGEFDFAESARAERVLCQIHADHPECVSRIARGSWWNWRRWLGLLRTNCGNLLWKHVHHSRAGLASAILLGAREQLERETTENFFVTGTVHILAISGLHVGILMLGFWWAGRIGLLGRKTTLAAAAAFVVTYALLTDAHPPVLRATILVLIVCASRWFGRKALSFNSLAAGGLVVLAISPAELFRTGAQLSFLAVATLAVIEPWLAPRAVIDPLDRLIEQTRPWSQRALRGTASAVWRLTLTSAAIWLVVLPLVWQRFCLISPIAVPLGPVLTLPISVALYFGFAVLLLGWLAPPLGDACGWICDSSLALVEGVIHLAQLIPANHFWLPPPPLSWIALFYAVLGLAIAFPKYAPPRRWSLAILALWWGVGLLASSRVAEHVAERDDRLACTFVSVGHGTSALLELPGGQVVLYDAGRMGSHIAGARSIAATIWSRRIRHLDAVIISHADADHYNALPELLERFSVGIIYVSPMMWDNREAPGLVELRRSIEASGVPLRELSAKDSILPVNGASLSVLHPPPYDPGGKDNSKSIVLQIDFAGRRILLPGDLEPPGLNDVLAEAPLDCDVVMAPHHGGALSNPRGFAAWSTPEFVVISGALGKESELVDTAYREAGAEVLHTAHGGAVRVDIDRTGHLQVRSWRKDPWN